jgi:hypothetical protein
VRGGGLLQKLHTFWALHHFLFFPRSLQKGPKCPPGYADVHNQETTRPSHAKFFVCIHHGHTRLYPKVSGLVQLYCYYVSHSSEFCRHNPFFCFSTSVYCCCLFRYRLSPETFRYTLVCNNSVLVFVYENEVMSVM